MTDEYKRIPRTTREAFGPSWASISGPYRRTIDLARVALIVWVTFAGAYTGLVVASLALMAWLS